MVVYDSYPADDPDEPNPLQLALDEFTQQTGIEVDVLVSGDTGTMLSKAALTAGNPEGDVMWGVDNTLLSRAIDADVFEPYAASALDGLPSELTALAPGHEATPVDFGDVCVNYDIAALAERGLDPPTSLADLVEPEYASLLVVENPASSSPGLAFLMALVAEFGDPGWERCGSRSPPTAHWSSTAGPTPTTRRSPRAGGDRPLVVSYGSSPPFEVLYSEQPLDAAPTGVVEATCFRQVEFAGILRGSEREDDARKLVDFLVSERFQREVAMNLFVWPVNPAVTLDPAFTSYADDSGRTVDARPCLDRSAPQRLDRPVDRTHTRLNRLPLGVVAALTIVPTAFLVVFYAWPFVTLLARAVDGASVGEVLGAPRTRRVLWFTFWQAALSTALTLVVAMPATWAIARFTFAGRGLLRGALTAVFVLPTVVIGAAFVALLPASLERGAPAIIAAHVTFNLAVVVRTVGAAWSQLPDEVAQAAATLGATPWTTFRLVTLPLLAPALGAAGAIVFLFSFTSFGVVRVLGTVDTTTIEVEVWRRATQLGDIGGAAVLALLPARVARTGRALDHPLAASAVASDRSANGARPARPNGAATLGVTGALIATWLIVAAPLVALVERSFRLGDGYSLAAWRSLNGTELRPGLTLGVDPYGSLVRSLTAMCWATVLSVLIGGAAVLAIDALGQTGRLLDAGLMLPLGTSAVTIGFGMLITFDTPPFDWRDQWWLVPVGQALVAIPFVVRSTLTVLRSIPSDLRSAAATLGASPTRAWSTTTLPLLRRPLAAGAGLAAAISLGEFGATSFLSRSGQDTVPIAIDRLLGRTGAVFQAQAFALATLLAVATIAVVVLVDRLTEGSGDARTFVTSRWPSISNPCSPTCRSASAPVSWWPARTVRQRQEHAAAGHRRDRRSRLGHDRDRRQRRHPHCQPMCDRSAWCSRTSSCSHTFGGRQHRVRTQDGACSQIRTASSSRRTVDAGRSRRVGRTTHRRAVGRRAQTRGPGAFAGTQPAPAAARRTVDRPRRRPPRPPRRRSRRDPAQHRNDGAVGHPRPQRSVDRCRPDRDLDRAVDNQPALAFVRCGTDRRRAHRRRDPRDSPTSAARRHTEHRGRVRRRRPRIDVSPRCHDRFRRTVGHLDVDVAGLSGPAR